MKSETCILVPTGSNTTASPRLATVGTSTSCVAVGALGLATDGGPKPELLPGARVGFKIVAAATKIQPMPQNRTWVARNHNNNNLELCAPALKSTRGEQTCAAGPRSTRKVTVFPDNSQLVPSGVTVEAMNLFTNPD